MVKIDITLLTDHRYVDPINPNEYTQNVLTEDRLVCEALERNQLIVQRTNWDNTEFDWSSTRFVLFRTTWDYFNRIDEFTSWMSKISAVTHFLNPFELIMWNLDKHYLCDLAIKGINIPPTFFIEQGDQRALSTIIDELNWADIILKPAVSGAARHTYRIQGKPSSELSSLFDTLIQNESMIIQEFQINIIDKGEVAFMMFGGKFSHAVHKKTKLGDFRVQDDFGGTIADYEPSRDEIEFVENVFKCISPQPIYARIDVIWDNQNQLAVGEVELIEPELWFRRNEKAADLLATSIAHYISQ